MNGEARLAAVPVLFSISADVPREEEPLALICGLWGEYLEKVFLEAGFEVTIR